MAIETIILCMTAGSVALLHTLLGPDHYLPFIAMSRAGRWSLRKTLLVTLACGLGHVLSSVVVGAVGVTLGISLLSVETFESSRGALAGWLLVAFGLVYFVWGVRRALRNRPHAHWHAHADGTVHTHGHVHQGEHLHAHDKKVADAARRDATSTSAPSLTPWVLFVIFLFGPCEPLIPLLIYPAAQGRTADVFIVAIVFGLVTLVAMASVVALAHTATKTLRLGWLERYAHAMTGLVMVTCGAAVKIGM